MTPVEHADALNGVAEFRSPEVVGRVNGHDVRLAKLEGEVAGHQHDAGDEMLQMATLHTCDVAMW